MKRNEPTAIDRDKQAEKIRRLFLEGKPIDAAVRRAVMEAVPARKRAKPKRG